MCLSDVSINKDIQIWHLYICVHCTWEGGIGGLHVPGQPGLHNGTLSLRCVAGGGGTLLVVISSVIYLPSPSELGNMYRTNRLLFGLFNERRYHGAISQKSFTENKS